MSSLRSVKGEGRPLDFAVPQHTLAPDPSLPRTSRLEPYIDTMMNTLQRIVESPRFQNFVIAVIVINAITLGLETSPAVMAQAGPVLLALDHAALAVFVVEIAMKLIVHRQGFFRSGWNVFDFTIVAITIALGLAAWRPRGLPPAPP